MLLVSCIIVWMSGHILFVIGAWIDLACVSDLQPEGCAGMQAIQFNAHKFYRQFTDSHPSGWRSGTQTRIDFGKLFNIEVLV